MKYHTVLMLSLSLLMLLCQPLRAQSSSDTDDAAATDIVTDIVLVQAEMCEDIQELTPQNTTTVFSIERRKAVCFTSFDPVPFETEIYHHWFHRDRPSARIKLALQPPRWSTYSSIQLRAEDLGPWRVEVTDGKGRIFQILRFSITE
jgi:hypothetical protein